MHRFQRVLTLASFLFGALVVRDQAAADEILQARIIPTPGAPVALTSCSFAGINRSQNLTNRSLLFLQAFSVRWTAFDHGGNAMGQHDAEFRFSSDLAPGDSTTQSMNNLDYFLTEPTSSLATWHCRLQTAKFEGGKSWEYGHTPWRGRLTTLPKDESLAPSREGELHAQEPLRRAPGSPPSNVAFTVTNAWNDSTSAGTIVHVSLEIKGTAREFTLRPDDVSLKLALSNGAKKAYVAMTQAAPAYQKISALTNEMIATPQVDPKSDLGRLGSILVPSNGSVRVTASFLIGTDTLANSKENRDVSIR
ncbi:MAG: hypothetical protein M3N13_09220 [Candidatus Eremiobacteraeota bacterium]|nr:hypothetical protein [Candidatus Eremiobacteraeota bacterium]